MKQRNLRFIAAAALILSATAASAEDGVLEGDARLACEATLCLASGKRPNECQPSLRRYFSISLRKWNDTANARRNFLKLCPASSDTSSADMPALVESLVQGSGRCDAAYLNATNTTVVEKQVCPNGSNAYLGDGCYMQSITVINNVKPAYCTAYANSPTTYKLGVTYVGDPLDGGRWVDDAAMTGQP